MFTDVGLYYLDGTRDLVLEEILRTEGVPYVRLPGLDDLGEICSLILGEVELRACDVDKLLNFVGVGGVLLAVRPDGLLCEKFGLEFSMETQSDGYLVLESPGQGYSGRLQVLGLSRLYSGGQPVAGLEPSNGHGGIIRMEYGRGCLIVIAFDVAGTFLSIQQPDSTIGRAYDTSRVEPDLAGVPQLDLMRRLIVNLILDEIPLPLPRKWYFPDFKMAAVLLGGDQDGSDYGRMAAVRELVEDLKAPYTLFTTPRNQPMSREEIKNLIESGLEIALHANFIGGPDFTREEFGSQLAKAAGDAETGITGGRNHALRWGSVMEMPLWMEELGLQYDSDLGLMLPEEGTQSVGYYVGGGLPYYFVHPGTFRRIDVLEQPLTAGDDVLFWDGTPLQVDLENPGWLPKHLYTESDAEEGRDRPENVNPGVKTYYPGLRLTEEGAFELSKKLMDDSLNRYHTVQCYNCHPLYLSSRITGEPYHHSDAFFRKTVEYAMERGVLLLNHGEWNDFWRRREMVEYGDLSWDPSTRTLTFSILNMDGPKAITHMVPLAWEGRQVEMNIDGKAASYRTAELTSGDYVMFTVPEEMESVRIEARYPE